MELLISENDTFFRKSNDWYQEFEVSELLISRIECKKIQ